MTNIAIPTKEWRHISVYLWFVIAYIILYIIPFVYLLNIGELVFDEPQTFTHLIFTLIYITSYLASGSIMWMIHKISSKPLISLSDEQRQTCVARKRQVTNTLANTCGWLATVMIVAYYLTGGYRKILLLGADVDPWEFRLMGFDDTSRVLTALLEVARRILMPYALLVKMAFNKYKIGKKDHCLLVFLPVAILGAIVNLDRGPIFLYLTLFFFFYIISSDASKIITCAYIVVFLFIVGMIGSMFTFLQYNIFDFDLVKVYQGSFAVLLERMVLDPVRMAELYAFGDIDLWNNPLYLKYSRLGALFGGQYVGTEHEFSSYVAPVGLFGDVWRNFGMFGAVYIGLSHGLIFNIISQWLKTSDLYSTLPLYYLLFILIFYLFYGGMFSQGPFALLFMIVTLARFNIINKKRFVWHGGISPVRAP